MAKKQEPETQDRFRIYAETSLEAMGPLLAQLTKMGLSNINYELITDVMQFQQRRAHDESSEELVRAWIAEHPTFKMNALSQHCAAHGRHRTIANHTVSKMVKAGELLALGGGHYQRADVKAIAPPEGEKERANAGHPTPRFEVSGYDAIWRHVKNKKKPFAVAELRTLFRAQGRTENSASPLVSKMQVDGLLKRTGDGEYQVIQGAKPPKPERKSRGPQPNAKRHYEVSNSDLILNHIGKRHTFAAAEIAELFGKNNRPTKSASSVLSQMTAKGLLKSAGVGQYEVIRKNTNGTGVEHAHV